MRGAKAYGGILPCFVVVSCPRQRRTRASAVTMATQPPLPPCFVWPGADVIGVPLAPALPRFCPGPCPSAPVPHACCTPLAPRPDQLSAPQHVQAAPGAPGSPESQESRYILVRPP